jgi:hypothetical protein
MGPCLVRMPPWNPLRLLTLEKLGRLPFLPAAATPKLYQTFPLVTSKLFFINRGTKPALRRKKILTSSWFVPRLPSHGKADEARLSAVMGSASASARPAGCVDR